MVMGSMKLEQIAKTLISRFLDSKFYVAIVVGGNRFATICYKSWVGGRANLGVT